MRGAKTKVIKIENRIHSFIKSLAFAKKITIEEFTYGCFIDALKYQIKELKGQEKNISKISDDPYIRELAWILDFLNIENK
jgi:hypothetical protein